MAKSFRGKGKKPTEKIPGNYFSALEETERSKTVEPKENIAPEQEKKDQIINKIFLMDRDRLEKLRDFIHTKKQLGMYDYNHQIALAEALDMLFETVENIKKRPKKQKDREKKISESIKAGKRKQN